MKINDYEFGKKLETFIKNAKPRKNYILTPEAWSLYINDLNGLMYLRLRSVCRKDHTISHTGSGFICFDNGGYDKLSLLSGNGYFTRSTWYLLENYMLDTNKLEEA